MEKCNKMVQMYSCSCPQLQLGLRVRVHAFASVNPRAVDASVQHVCLQAKEMENCSTWLSPRCVNAPTGLACDGHTELTR